jgi:DnaJ-class molecular chaperone
VTLYVFILSYSVDNGTKLLTIKNNIMTSYDDWKLATPDNEGDAINVECPECEGWGLNDDDEECFECNGTGIINN